MIPSLRERPEDIPALAERFLAKFSRQNGRKLAALHTDVCEMLQRYAWPGNVRELENAMERAVVLADRDAVTITPDLLPHTVQSAAATPPAQPAAAAP
jgi:Nif-specific regulatory protein